MGRFCKRFIRYFHDALEGQRVLWAASTAGGGAPWRVMRLTDRTQQSAVLPAVVAVAPAAAGGRGGRGGGGGGGGAGMTLSPNGKSLLFVADGQVRRVSVYPAPATPPLMDEVHVTLVDLPGQSLGQVDGAVFPEFSNRLSGAGIDRNQAVMTHVRFANRV